MFTRLYKWILGSSKNKGVGDDLEEQLESAEFLRDLLSLAAKMNWPVLLTVEVNGLRQGVLIHPKEEVAEYLYNFAAGEVLVKAAQIQEKAILAEKYKMRQSAQEENRRAEKGGKGD